MNSRSEASMNPALADIVDRITVRLERGEIVDDAVLETDYPEQAEELKKLLPTIRLLANVADLEQESSRPVPRELLGTIGDFRIIRLIGRGGMADVYEAEQISLGRRVALKVLPFAGTLDARQLQRFQNEARAAASLHHPHIVPVYAVGNERGTHYFAMQFIEGASLAEVIRGQMQVQSAPEVKPNQSTAVGRRSTLRNGRAEDDIRFAARVGKQAAEALEHAHSMGIVHRDMKPSNLLLDSSGDIWVADFGLARSRSHNLTRSGDLIGTLRYMSPEQALAKHDLVDHRTDIYSFGATLYELLTLRPVIEGDDQPTLLHKITYDDPIAPRTIRPEIPVALETIVQKALAKEPSQRYATAADLAEDLQRFLDDQPVRARRPNWAQRLGNWSRRHRTFVRSTFVIVFLTLATGLTALGVSRSRIQAVLDSEIQLNLELQASLERERFSKAEVQVALARACWNDHRLDDALRLLESVPKDYRNPEWTELITLCRAKTKTYPLSIVANRFAVSHNGKKLAIDAFVRLQILDLASGEITSNFTVTNGVHSSVFQENHQDLTIVSMQRLVMVGKPKGNLYDGDIISVWNSTTGTSLSQFQYPRSAIALSGDGTRAAGQYSNSSRVWDVRSGQVICEIPQKLTPAQELANKHAILDYNGRRFASFQTRESGSITIWDVDRSVELARLTGMEGNPQDCVFSRDGNRLAVITTSISRESGTKHTLSVWHLPQKRELFRLTSPSFFQSVSLTEDGSLVSWFDRSSRRKIELVDGNTGRNLASFRGHPNDLKQTSFSADGRQIFALMENQVFTWSVQDFLPKQ